MYMAETFLGKSCPKGPHNGEGCLRYKSSGNCVRYITEYATAWKERNPEKDSAMNARYRKSHLIERRQGERRARLRREYGISEDEWEQLFNSQGRRCAICRTAEPWNKRGWQTDHEHKTGKVRGILCQNCNMLVGWLEKSMNPQNVAKRALQYIDYREAEAINSEDAL